MKNLMSIMDPLGVMVGIVAPYAFISLEQANDPKLPWSITLDQYFLYMVACAGLAMLMLLLSAFMLEDHKKPRRGEEIDVDDDSDETAEKKKPRYGSIVGRDL